MMRRYWPWVWAAKARNGAELAVDGLYLIKIENRLVLAAQRHKICANMTEC
jgi:hypothetical protein